MENEKYVTYAHEKDPDGQRFSDLKSCNNLPSWAVDIQDAVKPTLPTIRTPFYALSDAVWGMSDASFALDDDEIVVLMSQIRVKLDELQNKLNEKYIWD